MSETKGEESVGQTIKTAYWWLGEEGKGRVRTVEYTEIDGYAVTEGCIILGSAERVKENMERVRSAPGLLKDKPLGIGIIGGQYRWENAEMPYEIETGFPDVHRIKGAMQHWTDKTGVKFVERNATNRNEIKDYVLFKNGNRCASHVGRQGGAQVLILGPNCGLGNAIHEIGHAFGLWHEHCRHDRDVFIEILWDNIEESAKHNFYQKLSEGEDIGDYDYGSIMHYGRTAFSKNDKETIRVVPGKQGQIGQRNGLSADDVKTIKEMYGL